MTKISFATIAAAVVALALATSWGVGKVFGTERTQTAPVTRAHAAWVYKTTDPVRMARDVDAIVVATWTAVGPGRVAYSSTGEDALAFELNDFAVEEVIKGTGIRGAIVLERVAADQGERRVIFEPDGGHFVPHTQYLLFLKKQPDTPFFIQINDEGRYVIDGQNRLRTPATGQVADALRGRTLADVRAFLRQALLFGR